MGGSKRGGSVCENVRSVVSDVCNSEKIKEKTIFSNPFLTPFFFVAPNRAFHFSVEKLQMKWKLFFLQRDFGETHLTMM